jgi:hypothetical protein
MRLVRQEIMILLGIPAKKNGGKSDALIDIFTVGN